MTDNNNMRIWDALSKTDPKQTKGFKRAGGFSGTAIKPMWVWSRLTEKFGPVGQGWGFKPPVHQVVSGSNQEVLVYTTVEAWYLDNGERCEVCGVGGDKVVTHIKANEQYKRPERWENDDEAFKKAFTDALMNAFKFTGVAADVHMGLFEDNKYVAELAKEFAEPAPQQRPSSAGAKQDDLWETIKEKFGSATDKADLDKRYEYFRARVPGGWLESLEDLYSDYLAILAEAAAK